jgi:succinate dehydrogenase / fumarate reductase membrane anchor subunit
VSGFRTPLARVRGLGSAKDGVNHWWAQRVTAVALVPLSLWLVTGVVSLAGADRPDVAAWAGSPVTAALLIMVIAATFHHAQLGLQVVIEDYVYNEGVKIAAIIAVKLLAALAALIGTVAVLKLAVAG